MLSKGSEAYRWCVKADFVPESHLSDRIFVRYDQLMEAFHGSGYHVSTAKQLQAATRKAFEARKPALLNVILDPYAGVESGNVHSFNAPKSNL